LSGGCCFHLLNKKRQRCPLNLDIWLDLEMRARQLMKVQLMRLRKLSKLGPIRKLLLQKLVG
jgi:hypothetical protein